MAGDVGQPVSWARTRLVTRGKFTGHKNILKNRSATRLNSPTFLKKYLL
jgi:hypothetical protein